MVTAQPTWVVTELSQRLGDLSLEDGDMTQACHLQVLS